MSTTNKPEVRGIPGSDVLALIQNDTAKLTVSLGYDLEQHIRLLDCQDRRLYLSGVICGEEYGPIICESLTQWIAEQIMEFNRIDRDLPAEERKPIRLYINSPGGDLIEGMALISVMKLSKTPITTINIGQWCSMAFLIGITGDRRLSLPNATFLMHDGTSGAFGSTSKVQDQIEFEKRFEQEVVKRHVLEHSTMKEVDYNALARVELYMLPEDALERGFIDEIVSDIDEIL